MLQINHGIAQILFLFHQNCNLTGLALADATDLRQPFRFLLYDPKGILPESAHNSGSQCGAYSLNGAGAKIAFYAGSVFRHHNPVTGHLELGSIEGMFYIFSFCRNIFSLRESLCRSHTDYFLSLGHQVHNRISVIAVLEDNMFYITVYRLH